MPKFVLRVSPFLVFLSVGQPQRYEFTEVHMGMPVRMVLYAGSDSAARAAARAAFRRIAELDNTFSDYRPQSEARRLAERAGEWTPVSAEMLELLSKSVELSRATGGAFDVTVAPITKLWREARRRDAGPSHDQIVHGMRSVGWRRIEVDSMGRRVRLEPGTTLDFGGIAKGYIIGEARRRLAAAGVRAAMIEAGGDIVVGDAPPGERGWKISIAGTIEALANCAVATSGSTYQFVEIDGKRHSHVVDPRDGIGVIGNDTVYVIGQDPAVTDAIATAALVLGHDPTIPGLSVRIAYRKGR